MYNSRCTIADVNDHVECTSAPSSPGTAAPLVSPISREDNTPHVTTTFDDTASSSGQVAIKLNVEESGISFPVAYQVCL